VQRSSLRICIKVLAHLAGRLKHDMTVMVMVVVVVISGEAAKWDASHL
jgi:hypothetical protein